MRSGPAQPATHHEGSRATTSAQPKTELKPNEQPVSCSPGARSDRLLSKHHEDETGSVKQYQAATDDRRCFEACDVTECLHAILFSTSLIEDYDCRAEAARGHRSSLKQRYLTCGDFLLGVEQHTDNAHRRPQGAFSICPKGSS